MEFVSLGMFIIDEIHYQPPRKPDLDVMGGAGMYAALGARLFRPPPSAAGIGWILHEGHDFPLHIKSTIDTWKTTCEFIRTPNRETTRARNTYGSIGFRDFHYLNDKIRLDENSLTPTQLTSKSYHLICSAQRCRDIIDGILARRKAEVKTETDTKIRHLLTQAPVFVWEPVPASCQPSELEECLNTLRFVDVFSPNLEEFGSLLGIGIDLDQLSGWPELRQRCEELIEPTHSPRRATAVIRLGEKGCYVAQPGRQYFRLPAYYEPEASSTAVDSRADDKREPADRSQKSTGRVVDPTGGGNAFLGGFAIGLQHSEQANMREAAAYGTVAASFAIEQIGVPTLGLSPSGAEMWNGVSVEGRLKEYNRRLSEIRI
ncbi:MAG: hypothetical protein L6R42_000639 [Xanthoria sp. 1 TBL-2021]|nr:MAG: hypothetical protein L6R42_000639 [Xanthoria sp. 1 TBL-2021]